MAITHNGTDFVIIETTGNTVADLHAAVNDPTVTDADANSTQHGEFYWIDLGTSGLIIGDGVTTAGSETFVDWDSSNVSIITRKAGANALRVRPNATFLVNYERTGTAPNFIYTPTNPEPAGVLATTQEAAMATNFGQPFFTCVGAIPGASWHHSGDDAAISPSLVLFEGDSNTWMEGVTMYISDAPKSLTGAIGDIRNSLIVTSNYQATGSASRGFIFQKYDDNTLLFTNSTLIGWEFLPNATAIFNGLVRRGSNAGFFNAGRANVPAQLIDPNFSENFVDLGSENTAVGTSYPQTQIFNSANGTAMTAQWNTGSGTQVKGDYRWIKRFDTNITNFDTNADLEGVVLWIRDNDNGGRKTLPLDPASTSPALTAAQLTSYQALRTAQMDQEDKTYLMTTGADGSLTTSSFRRGAAATVGANGVDITTGICSWVTGADNGVQLTPAHTNVANRKDLRGKTNVEGADLFDVYVWRYGFQPAVAEVALTGNGQFVFERPLFVDPNAVKTFTQVVADWANQLTFSESRTETTTGTPLNIEFTIALDFPAASITSFTIDGVAQTAGTAGALVAGEYSYDAHTNVITLFADLPTGQDAVVVYQALTGNITTAANLTMDDLYDYTTYRRAHDNALIEVPNVSTGLMTSNGVEINTGLLNLTLGGSLTGDLDNKHVVTTPLFSPAGNGLSGIVFDGVTTGNFGALTNNTSITTSNTVAQTVASTDNSSIISTGALTVSGNAAESKIQSTGGTVTVSGTSTDNDIDAGGIVTITGYTTRGTINNTASQIDLFGGGEDTILGATGHIDIEPVTGEEYTRITASHTSGNAADIRAQNTTLVDCTFTANRDVLLTEANVSGGTYTAGDDIQAEDATITAGSFTAEDEIDLDNAVISGGEFETVDDIVLTNATVTGGTFTSTGNVLAANGISVTGATISNAFIQTRRVFLVRPGIFVDNNTFGEGGRDLQIDFNITLADDFTLTELLGTDYHVAADTTVFTNNTPNTVTIEVNAFDVAEFNIRNGETGAADAPLAQGQTSLPINNIRFRFVAPGTTTTFTNQASANGGNLALFQRATAGAAWTLTETQTVGVNAIADIEVTNLQNEWLTLWKPLNSTTYTNINYGNEIIIPPVDNEIETLTRPIVGLLLSAEDDIPAGVTYSIVWTNETLGGFNQFVGTIAGTNNDRLGGGATQTLLRDGLTEQAYFDFLVTNIADVASTDAAVIQATGYSVDFIEARDPNSTRVNGTFLELETSDGTQQRLTAVENSGDGSIAISGKISAEISRTEPGAVPTTVTFDAVDLADNPQGISAEQVREAVRTLTEGLSSEHARLSQNQQANQVAIQRGAVKAATYSADDIDIIT